MFYNKYKDIGPDITANQNLLNRIILNSWQSLMSQFSAVASAGCMTTVQDNQTHAANSTRLILLSHANDSPLPLLVFSNILFLPSIILIKAYHMLQINNFYCFYCGIHFCPLPFLLSLKHNFSESCTLLSIICLCEWART